MTVRVTESRLPNGYLATELGQVSQHVAASGAKYILVAFLTSPFRKETEQEYVVFVIDADADEYQWTIRPPAGPPLREVTTDVGSLTHTYVSTGFHSVEVKVMEGGSVRATLALTQAIREPVAALEMIFDAEDVAHADGQHVDNFHYIRDRDSLRELWNEFAVYIEDAASATGSNGVPPRLVASILKRETWGRPKRGTAGALDMILMGGDPDDVRQTEQDAMAWGYEVGKGNLLIGPMPPVPGSLGPGQLMLMTIAALEGLITWREGAAAGTSGLEIDRKFVLYLNVTDFMNLAYAEQIDMFNLARFPKSNIMLVAKLLAKLKNRSNRWPSVAKDDVENTERLVMIVATEYNLGPTATPAASATENMYGSIVSGHYYVHPDAVDDLALFGQLTPVE